MGKERFSFGGEAFKVETEKHRDVSYRCYKCFFYAKFCIEKRAAGDIPPCECHRRADGMDAFFVRDDGGGAA